MADRKSVIVVGAGAGGIATAARLAKAGFQVTVVEKNDFTGGRCSLIHHGGYVRKAVLQFVSMYADTRSDLTKVLLSYSFLDSSKRSFMISIRRWKRRASTS